MKWPGHNKTREIKFCGWPLVYRFNRGDLQSLREVLVEEVYHCEIPFEPQTALDLGANIGLTSLWMWKRLLKVTEETKIIAVEPAVTNADVAETNFRLNRIRGEVVRAAVGQQSGIASFMQRAESNVGRVTDGSGAVSIPVIGIRELISRYPGGAVDVVKMDIEGSEGPLFSTDLGWLSCVRALMVEWHDEIVPSGPLIENVTRAGFAHSRINAERQENLSLFVRKS